MKRTAEVVCKEGDNKNRPIQNENHAGDDGPHRFSRQSEGSDQVKFLYPVHASSRGTGTHPAGCLPSCTRKPVRGNHRPPRCPSPRPPKPPTGGRVPNGFSPPQGCGASNAAPAAPPASRRPRCRWSTCPRPRNFPFDRGGRRDVLQLLKGIAGMDPLRRRGRFEQPDDVGKTVLLGPSGGIPVADVRLAFDRPSILQVGTRHSPHGIPLCLSRDQPCPHVLHEPPAQPEQEGAFVPATDLPPLCALHSDSLRLDFRLPQDSHTAGASASLIGRSRSNSLRQDWQIYS
jgi:hypothetical protein